MCYNKDNIIWLSLDPCSGKINYYPIQISLKIEYAYIKYKNYKQAIHNYDYNNVSPDDYLSPVYSYCFLGSDYYNSTIHFDYEDFFYQTTPRIPLVVGYKVSGKRSVKRIIVNSRIIPIYVTMDDLNEWKIINYIRNDTKTIIETIPNDVIITFETLREELTTWNLNDIECSNNNKNLIVWQMCDKLLKFDNIKECMNDTNLWIPFSCSTNEQIENAFKRAQLFIVISDPNIYNINKNSERVIIFNNNFSFATLKDINNNNIKLIKRTILNINDLKTVINKTKYYFFNEFFNSNIISDYISNKYISTNDIPPEFICSISHEIMKEPVTTVDGFTYEKEFIEKWFQKSYKSPLTGLRLKSKQLNPNIELKNEIINFIDNIIIKYSN